MAQCGPGGANSSGQLGDGTTIDRQTAVKTKTTWGTRTIAQIATGSRTAYARATDGTVWAWGDNTSYQGGAPNPGTGPAAGGGFELAPTPVTRSWGQRGITSIAAGAATGYALADNGSLWAWGADVGGVIGIGTNSQTEPAPVLVNAAWSGHALTGITAGRGDGYALDDSGQAWSWGGALALGVATDQSRAVPDRVDQVLRPIAVRFGTGLSDIVWSGPGIASVTTIPHPLGTYDVAIQVGTSTGHGPRHSFDSIEN